MAQANYGISVIDFYDFQWIRNWFVDRHSHVKSLKSLDTNRPHARTPIARQKASCEARKMPIFTHNSNRCHKSCQWIMFSSYFPQRCVCGGVFRFAHRVSVFMNIVSLIYWFGWRADTNAPWHRAFISWRERGRMCGRQIFHCGHIELMQRLCAKAEKRYARTLNPKQKRNAIMIKMLKMKTTLWLVQRVQSTRALLSNVHDTLLSLQRRWWRCRWSGNTRGREKNTPTNTNKCTAVIVIRNDFSFEWAKSDCSQSFFFLLRSTNSILTRRIGVRLSTVTMNKRA